VNQQIELLDLFIFFALRVLGKSIACILNLIGIVGLQVGLFPEEENCDSPGEHGFLLARFWDLVWFPAVY
jgi:hypothetical protein